MEQSSIEKSVLDLARSGCCGNTDDFKSWIEYSVRKSVNPELLNRTLNELTEKTLLTHISKPAESFSIAEKVSFPEKISYAYSAVIKDAPIQLVRSRLESFLNYHNASEDAVIDILIAVTEAVENSIKYSGDNQMEISYEISGKTFSLRMINTVAEISLENDIASGKFDSTKTLMRGIMVMNKLFDKMNIDFSEDNKKAILTAEKTI